jgi:hypothetical protein
MQQARIAVKSRRSQGACRARRGSLRARTLLLGQTGPVTTKSGAAEASVSVVEAVIALPFALPLNADRLGKVTHAKIGSVNAQVHLPSLKIFNNGTMFLEGPGVRSVRSDIDWATTLHNHSPWGSVVSWRKTGGGQPADIIADLYHVLFRAQVPQGTNGTHEQQTQAIADEIARNVWIWLALIGDWFEITTGVYLERTSRQGVEALTVGAELHLWSFDGQKGYELPGTHIIRGAQFGRVTTSAASWRRIIAKANNNLSPPVEHLFLRDARGSLRHGDTRRAVLDAATAAEISLALLLDQHITTASGPIQTVVRAANRDMGRLTTTLRKNFGVTLPSGIQTGLTDRRNEAIHSGLKPSWEAAKSALDIAVDIVDLATPRSTLLTFR